MSSKLVVLSAVFGLISAQPLWFRAANYVPPFWRIGLAPPSGLIGVTSQASNPGVSYTGTIPSLSVPKQIFATSQKVAYTRLTSSPAVTYVPFDKVANIIPGINVPVLPRFSYQQSDSGATGSAVSSTQNYAYESSASAQNVNGLGSAAATQNYRALGYDTSSATSTNNLGYSVSRAESTGNSLGHSSSSFSQSIDEVGSAVSTAEMAEAYGEYNAAVSTSQNVGDVQSSSSQVVQHKVGATHRSTSSVINGQDSPAPVLYYY